jgi:hypothetical protein
MQKLLITALLAFGFFACDDNVDPVEVPDNVRTAFESAYPGATDVEWEMDDDHYEVEFMLDGQRMDTDFDMNGMEFED